MSQTLGAHQAVCLVVSHQAKMVWIKYFSARV